MTTSLKVKPLSLPSVHMVVADVDGNVLEDRVLKIGEYLDIVIPDGGSITLTDAPEGS